VKKETSYREPVLNGNRKETPMPRTKRITRAAAKPSHPECALGVCDPRRTQGLRAPAPKGTHDLVNLEGPGLFLSANVSKQGGPTNITFVRLDIDGRSVVNLSFAAARNWGLSEANPFGLQFLSGIGVESFAIGWPFPLAFKRSLKLSVVVNENDVVQIVVNVVHASTG
jgi:hypothetical protein